MSKLCVICGMAGTGKTLIAGRLAAETGMVYIETDTIARQIPDDLFTVNAEVTSKLCDVAEKAALNLCKDNLQVGNSVILVTQRYTRYEEWEKAVKKSGVDFSSDTVDFYVVSRKDEERQETNSAYHYINSSNVNLDNVKELFVV